MFADILNGVSPADVATLAHHGPSQQALGTLKNPGLPGRLLNGGVGRILRLGAGQRWQ